MGVRFFPPGKRKGQKFAVVHLGTIRTPRPLTVDSFLMTDRIFLTGGQIQQFSWSQLWLKASTPKPDGHRKFEKNRPTFLLDSSAKQSIVKGPSSLFSHANDAWSMLQSSVSGALEPASAMTILGSSRSKWIGCKLQFRDLARDKTSITIVWMTGFVEPFVRKVTKFVESVNQYSKVLTFQGPQGRLWASSALLTVINSLPPVDSLHLSGCSLPMN